MRPVWRIYFAAMPMELLEGYRRAHLIIVLLNES